MAETHSGVGPHIRGEDSTRSLMLDVLIALSPSFLWGFYAFGARAMVILVLSVAFCIGIEAAILRFFPAKGKVSDLSAAVTGAILAAALPASTPLWLIPLGALIAVGLGKALFGGLGRNPFNPALLSLGILFLCFPKAIRGFIQPFTYLPPFAVTLSPEALENVLAPSPLEALSSGGLSPEMGFSQLLTGSVPGGIASSSVLLLLAGGLYLAVRHVISWHIPVGTLASVALFSFLLPQSEWESPLHYVLTALFSGSLVFCVLFCATDPVTSPITRKGKLVYSFLLGALTVLFRKISNGPDGAVFAILIASLFSRPLDYFFRPRVYGKKSTFFSSFRELPSILRPKIRQGAEKLKGFVPKKK